MTEIGEAEKSALNVSVDVVDEHMPHPDLDEDGRPRRSGTMWTASAHIVTAVIGSGVLSLAWAIAQLGWIAGPSTLLLFSVITCYTSTLLAECYRHGDPITGKRNYQYMSAVRSYLGGFNVKFCGLVQYANLFGVTIGYTIASAISLIAIEKAHCFHNKGHGSPCHSTGNSYMIGFGVVQIFLSQIPDFNEIWWLSIVAAVMSFSYSGIGLGLGIAMVVENKGFKGSIAGISSGHVITEDNVWPYLQALGNIAFAYSFSMILIEIQDTIKAPPPSEALVMKKATVLSTFLTTSFYLVCGCIGYGAFGDKAPGNLLTGFGFYEPYWLLDIANVAIVVHLVGAYQVFAQPLFAFVERWAEKAFPNSEFIRKVIEVGSFKLCLFRLAWRSAFVVLTTTISMLLPFFNDVVGLLGALAFWPLTVYFPVEMHIVREEIPKWSPRWLCLQLLGFVCFLVTVGAGVGSIVGVIKDLKVYKPFHSEF